MQPEAAAAVAAHRVTLRSWRDQLCPAARVLGSGRFLFFFLPTNNPVFPINTPRRQPGLRLFIS